MLFYINLVKLEIVRLLGKQELHSFRDGWSRFERERERERVQCGVSGTVILILTICVKYSSCD